MLKDGKGVLVFSLTRRSLLVVSLMRWLWCTSGSNVFVFVVVTLNPKP